MATQIYGQAGQIRNPLFPTFFMALRPKNFQNFPMAKKKTDSEAVQGSKSTRAKSRKEKPTEQELPSVQPKPAPKRKVRVTKPRKAAAPKASATPPRPTNEEIALRAYYIAERRQRMGWPGDSCSDWLEAERQLLAEAAGEQ